jgi:Zn-dependent peptidase ImmA (M78 family)
MNPKKIEELTSKLLQELNINKIPIPISEVAERKGLKVMPYDLGENVSGVLVIKDGMATIGVNPLEGKVRQRFTIAHELAHYELHRHLGDLFIDKDFKVHFRDQNSSTGEILKEQEANSFAAAILMPKEMLVKEIRKNEFNLLEEESVKKLAKLFDVSIAAMTYRIANLNLFGIL